MSTLSLASIGIGGLVSLFEDRGRGRLRGWVSMCRRLGEPRLSSDLTPGAARLRRIREAEFEDHGHQGAVHSRARKALGVIWA